MAIQYEQLKQELVDEFGLGVLAPEKQEEMLLKMTEVLMKRIFVDTMEKLGETGMDEYERLIESNPKQSEIEAFLNERIPDYSDMIDAIVIDFKTEMKAEN